MASAEILTQYACDRSLNERNGIELLLLGKIMLMLIVLVGILSQYVHQKSADSGSIYCCD